MADAITPALQAAFEHHLAAGERLGLEGWRPSRGDFRRGWYAGLAWLIEQQHGELELHDDQRRAGWCISLTLGGGPTAIHLAGPFRSHMAARDSLQALRDNLGLREEGS